MKFKILVLLVSFLFITYGFAQKKKYKDCEITLNDGITKKGTCTMPNAPKDVGFFFKHNGAERVFIKSDEVKRIKLKNKEGKTMIFDYLQNTRINHKENSVFKDKEGKQWMFLSYYTPTMSVYNTSTEYKLDKWDKLHLTSFNNATDFAISFYLMRFDNEYPRFMVDYQDGKVSDNIFNRNLYYLFKDQPKVYQVMRGKKFGWEDINKIAELYNYFRLKAEEEVLNDNDE